MMPLALPLMAMFLVGVCLGSAVNWATYAWAWRPRPVSPWMAPPAGAEPRRFWPHRLPVVGWFALRRDAPLLGPGFWLRPLLVELSLGTALAALYWWEVKQFGLLRGQGHFGPGMSVPAWPLFWQMASHVVLLCLMLVASFIDIDEKIIPDEITVTGTLLGLVLATAEPMSLLPSVAERAVAPVDGVAVLAGAGGQAVGPHGNPLWLEPVTAAAPGVWPPAWADPQSWQSLAVALACYWLWCFALAPRIWRGRRGAARALQLIAARVRRELCRPPLLVLAIVGTVGIFAMWLVAGNLPGHAAASWAGLLTALVGLVASGGIVWAVRLIGTAALRREAMGFGDVTLMMMIGTFLGWQAGVMLFFLAPFAGLLVGLAQLLFRRDQEIPYGPWLCLAAVVVVVLWAPIWNWGQPLFDVGWLVPLVLGIGLVLLGLMLAVWQAIKTLLFGRAA